MRLLPSLTAALLLASGLACSDSTVGTNNSPPEASIDQPSAGAVFEQGDAVTFVGSVSDSGTPARELTVTWSSSIDGELSAGSADDDGGTGLTTSALSPGEHTITLQVRDPQGATGQASSTLAVQADAPPSITIESPLAAGTYYSDQPVLLEATVQDAEDAPTELSVTWATDGGDVLVADETPDSAGTTSNSVLLEAGTWTLDATVTDTAGNTRLASVTIPVGPPNTDPTCAITGPASLSTVGLGELVLLEGTVADVDVSPLQLTVAFSSNVDGALGDATPSSAGAVALGLTSLSAGTHTVTMSVTDEVGGACSDFIVLTVSSPPSVVITSPAASDALAEGVAFSATGTVGDTEDAASSLLVAWSSDVDGALATPTPSAAGEVASSFALTAGAHVLSLTATDSSGLSAVATVAVDVNAAPSAPVVSISPGSPATTDALTVNLDTPSVDPDGGPLALTYTYAWSVGGAAQGGFSPPETVPSGATSTGETWDVTVTAFDGLSYSAPATASVTVGNSPPSITGVTISPSVAYTDTQLTANVAGWFDADGDAPDYVFEWFADGAPVGGDAATLDGSEFAKDDVITVLVTPIDGSSSGASVLSAGLTVLNTLPGAPTVSITPSAPTDADALSCSVSAGSYDADGDAISYAYAWSDGASTSSGATLSSNATTAGDTWTCTVTPNDGDGDGASGAASVTVTTSSTCGGGPSPNTCAPNCDTPANCLNNWSTLSCAPPVVTAAYFTNCSSIPFSGATYCFVVEGQGFQLDYTTQGGNMKWGSDRSGGFNGSNWNWLYQDQLVVTFGPSYSNYVGLEFWIENPDGQESGCVTIGWQP